MELNRNYIKHLWALLAGLIIGWTMQPWPSTDANGTSKAYTSNASHSVSSRARSENKQIKVASDIPSPLGIVEDEESPATKTNHQTDQDQAIDMRNWSGQELINYISSLADNKFWELMNAGEFKSALEKSPRLFDELMSGVLDIQDRSVNRKLLYLFETMETNYIEGQAEIRHPVETWVMQRVESENRATEWLSFMSQLGVNTKQSYMYLGSRLRDYADPSQTTAILSILARKPYLLDQSLTSEDVDSINQIIEPYLSSENDSERMFAVASLSSLPFEQSEPKLRNAMTDDSVRVRMSAMRIIRDNKFVTPQISKSLVASLTDKSLTAYERLGAYEVLHRAALNQEQYQAVYSFAEKERVALEQEFYLQRQAAQKQSQ